MAQLGPTPDGSDLTFEVECRTSRSASRGRLHPVTIHADWSVTTPHDLDAERVAMALGGYTSCIDLVDRTVPALQELIGLRSRRVRPPITYLPPRRWEVPSVVGCGCARAFPSAAAAATHLRTEGHVGGRFEAPRGQLTRALEVVEVVWHGFRAETPAGWDPAVHIREPGGLQELWKAGLHPDQLPAFAELAAGVTEPLPVQFYLGVAYGDVDPGLLADALAHRPDPDVAAWLAWAPGLLSQDTGRWLELGVSRRELIWLVEHEVSPDAAYEAAAGTWRTPHRAAVDLAVWAEAGVTPSVEDLALLDRAGLGSTYRPSAAVLDQLYDGLHHLPMPPTRDDLAMLLGLLGTRPRVIAAVSAGVRSAQDLMSGRFEMEAG